ncbi:MAG TPA: triose-phosphate isomerase [Ignavibacteria bacterium]|nr:triose-phosphate isomerase [Ignavibacteria bacterium]
MRRKFIAGNWKMNLGYRESEKLAKEIKSKLEDKYLKKTDVLICPSFISLGIVNKTIRDTEIKLGAQDLYFENDGAFTGEVSSDMIKSVGCEYVIIGHSERRKYQHESNKLINLKINKAIRSGLKPILCIGESLEEREDEIYESVIIEMLRDGLLEISPEDMLKIVIAYEPVWAIGTGLNATPEQASEIHGFIRKYITDKYDPEIAKDQVILYGGSVNGNNAREILSAKDVDGALIGGASLKPDEFCDIVKIAYSV